MQATSTAATCLTQLATGAQTGSRADRSALARHAQCYVQRLSRRLVANPADAEEIAQDVLLTALACLDQYEQRASFETWLSALLRSKINRRYRRQRPTPFCALGFEPERGDGDAFANAADAHQDVRGALRLLSTLDRTIVIGRDVAGMSSEEVAASTRMSVAAVKSRLHRARACLRDHLSAA